MRSSALISLVHCHAEGEVGDVVTGGVLPPPGRTVWDQAKWIADDKRLRDFLLNEPRGGVFRHVNLLVPPKHPEALAAFIIMEPADTPPMSGSNSICVATVLLETGFIPMQEPETHFKMEAPGGIVEVCAMCADGKVLSVKITNHASFCTSLDSHIELEGHGTIRVDTAFGGDSFAIVDAADLGFSLHPDEARDLAELGVRISAAATEQIGFKHPKLVDWKHLSFCLFATPIIHGLTKHAVAIRPGKIDRSPTGTGVSARMATLHARKEMSAGDTLTAQSLIGSRFVGRIESEVMVGDQTAIIPSIEGRAWITGTSQLMLDPTDPWPRGYRLSDTWPGGFGGTN